MHAVLHLSFKDFVENHHSRDLYIQILNEAGLEEAKFEAENYHNDAEVDQAIAVAEKILSQSRNEFLSDMGNYGAPGLLEQFKAFLDPDWNVLDMVENVESSMHKYVREEMGAFPPALKTERLGENELKVDVLSHRKMAGLAKGFIEGFATHYGDAITIDIESMDAGYSFLIKIKE